MNLGGRGSRTDGGEKSGIILRQHDPAEAARRGLPGLAHGDHRLREADAARRRPVRHGLEHIQGESRAPTPGIQPRPGSAAAGAETRDAGGDAGQHAEVEIQRALDLADPFKFNLRLAGGAEAGKVAVILKSRNIPVLLAVKYPERPATTDPDAREELDSLRRRVEAPGNAAALAKAGVRFAFVSDDIADAQGLPPQRGPGGRGGLDKNTPCAPDDLPAELLGVSDRLGSIEKNKTANLILTTGDLFDAQYASEDSPSSTARNTTSWNRTRAREPAPGGRARPGGGRSRGRHRQVGAQGQHAPQGAMEATLEPPPERRQRSPAASRPRWEPWNYRGTINGNRLLIQHSLWNPRMGAW